MECATIHKISKKFIISLQLSEFQFDIEIISFLLYPFRTVTLAEYIRKILKARRKKTIAERVDHNRACPIIQSHEYLSAYDAEIELFPCYQLMNSCG